MEIIVGSNNQGKLHEMQLGLAEQSGIQLVSYQKYTDELEIEETGTTYFENAYLKAYTYAEKLKKPVLADDGGLEIVAFPEILGLKTARFFQKNATDTEKNQQLLALFKQDQNLDRTIILRATLVYAFPEGTYLTASASLKGELAFCETGDLGYGFDKIFYLPKIEKTLAQLPKVERNAYSPRMNALEQMIQKIKEHEDDC